MQDDAMAPSMLLDPASLARRNQSPRDVHAPSGPPLGRSCRRHFLHSHGSTGTPLPLQHRGGKCFLRLPRSARPNEEKSPAAWLLLGMSNNPDRCFLIGTLLQPYVILVFVTEQLQTTLHQYRGSGHEGAVPGPFDESTQLEQTVQVFLSTLPRFNLGHQ